MNIPQAVYLYKEGISGINFQGLREFIHNNFGSIKVRLINLKDKVVHTAGLLFDLISTQRIFSRIQYSKEKDSCHIIFTKKLFVTYDAQKQIHIRSSIFSFPSVISIPGIVEGPAKPKEYYVYKQKYTQLGIWNIEEANVKKRLKHRFIDYADRRLNEVLKGHISQALFFYITGEPFCPIKSCRLYNAHWQEELIKAQVKSKRFCPEHKQALKEIMRAVR